MARWEHQTGTPSPGPVNGGQSSASFMTPGTEAEWTGYVENVSPWLSEASFDSMVCDFERLVTAQVWLQNEFVRKGKQSLLYKKFVSSPQKERSRIGGVQSLYNLEIFFKKNTKVGTKYSILESEKNQNEFQASKKLVNTSDIQNFKK